MSEDKQRYKGTLKDDGTMEIEPMQEPDGACWALAGVIIGGIIGVFLNAKARRIILLVLVSLFVTSVIITVAMHSDSICLSELTMVDSAHVSFEKYNDDSSYIYLKSYVVDGETIVAYANFKNQHEDHEKWKWLVGSVSLERESPYDQMTCRIYTNGQLVYDSGVMDKNSEEQRFEINIEGVSDIRIEAYCNYSEYHSELMSPAIKFVGELFTKRRK